MPFGIIPSGRAPKSIVVHSPVPVPTSLILTTKDLGEPTVLNVLPKRARLRKDKRICSCTTTVYVNLSMNSFSITHGELRSRKRMQRYTLFRFSQNIHKKNIHFNPIFNILKRFKRSKTPLHLIYINRKTS